LNENGTPDGAFAEDGVFRINTAEGETLSSLVIQPDGKILVLGIKGKVPYYQFFNSLKRRWNA